MKVSELINNLSQNFDPNAEVAYMIWQRDDLKQFNDTLTEKDCDTILRTIDRTKDCSLGITWGTIESAVLDYVVEE